MTRRVGIVFMLVVGAVMLPAPGWAHGLGGRSDLPVPLEYFLVGAFVVLVVSFGALAVLWPEPRLQDGPRFRGRSWRPPTWLGAILAGLSVLFLLLVIAAGLFGDGDARSNIAPVSVWVLFWLVLPFLGAFLGNLWAVLNPWRAIGGALSLQGPAGPGRFGVYPAAAAFVASTWMELVYPHAASVRSIGVAAVGYTVYLVAWSWRVGTDRAMATADAFTVYHRLLSSIAPIGRDTDGRLRRRGWLRALPALPRWPGVTLFVIAMIGTVTFDGLSATVWWDDLSFALVGVAQQSVWFNTLGLLVVVAFIWGGYLAACAWAARIARTPDLGARAIADHFAHTLVPIALAYAVAHYFTLIAFEGQRIVASVSDPLGLGWNLFGTVDFRENFTWLAPTAVWWVQVAAIVGGHVTGVVLAHDRALAVFPAERAVRTQYAMLALMVALTALGLTILAAS